MTFAIALMVSFAFGLANFVYQGLTGHAWAVAMERTWFQTAACLAVAISEHYIRRSVGGA